MAQYGNVQYYKDGFINPELVTDYAKKYADLFCDPKNPKGPDNISSAQLRRFYGDVKNLEMRCENSSDENTAFLSILPLIKLLKAKAAYAKHRKLVNQAFKDWIWDNVDKINDKKDFDAFLLYFEAVVGFCYGNGLND